MDSTVRLVLIGAAAVLSYDALASVLGKATGIPYKNFTAGSFAIYTTVGILAAKWGINAAFAGGATGLIDSTLGWYLSAKIGPGRLSRPLTTRVVAKIIGLVTLTAIIFATLGYFAHTVTARRF